VTDCLCVCFWLTEIKEDSQIWYWHFCDAFGTSVVGWSENLSFQENVGFWK